MHNIPPIVTLRKRFDNKFKSFDYDFYNHVISERQMGATGYPNGSCLLKEVASISAFFMDEHILQEISIEDCCYCAFIGWRLSYDFLSKEASVFKINMALNKFTKEIYRHYRELGIKLNKSDIAWLIFCCALIREKFYKDFLYNMQGFSITIGKEDGNRISVTYTLDTKTLQHENFNQNEPNTS